MERNKSEILYSWNKKVQFDTVFDKTKINKEDFFFFFNP